LFEAYREGISAGVFSPAMHGTTHFCRPVVERHLQDPGERGVLLRNLWKAGVPYIHWRMPWIGFEYWDPDQAKPDFLTPEVQQGLMDSAVEGFTRFFCDAPRSACAPGYRANRSTHETWAKHGIQVAQNGPGGAMPPHFDRNGILHLHRSMDFEPASGPNFSVDSCLRVAEDCFERGVPAIVSVHSINFHSTLKDFRSRTVTLLDEFLTALEAKRPDLLYVRDVDLYDVVDKGVLCSSQSTVRVPVRKKKFMKSALAGGFET
jgi:hypothetical protein